MFRKNEMNKEQVGEKHVVNPADATKVVNGLIDDEKYFKHLLCKLGDALQFVASPGEDMGMPDRRMTVLEVLSEARLYFYNTLDNIEQLKRGKLPDYLNED